MNIYYTPQEAGDAAARLKQQKSNRRFVPHRLAFPAGEGPEYILYEYLTVEEPGNPEKITLLPIGPV